jgi:putative pyruvate formate lyase activating enzyme
MKKILRAATDEDNDNFLKNLKDADKCLEKARKIAKELELDMSILDASYTLDSKQLLFNFIADERIDFRELAKRLAAQYKTRIELRQIGARDKARAICGIGQCGRPLCCSTFLNHIDSVTTNMAKNQNIALNPSKINGLCGRLLCCLTYEDEEYVRCGKGLPNVGQTVSTEFGKGKVVSVEEFSDICLELQDKGASNINLVTPTHYVPYIVEGLRFAKERGLNIPIVYNSSGYENVDTIKMLEGIVDIYLPDLKYYDDKYGVKYSNVFDYFKYASMAIEEMVRQVGSIEIDDNGMMKKGVIVRHLLLPGAIDDSKKIIKYLYEKYKDNIIISIMNQYTPVRRLEYEELNSKVSNDDYDELINYAYDFGVRKAFIQEGDTQEISFIPDFDLFRAI